jgi:hypothetical protein
MENTSKDLREARFSILGVTVSLGAVAAISYAKRLKRVVDLEQVEEIEEANLG